MSKKPTITYSNSIYQIYTSVTLNIPPKGIKFGNEDILFRQKSGKRVDAMTIWGVWEQEQALWIKTYTPHSDTSICK